MQTPVLLALALVVRCLQPVGGVVDFAIEPGQSVVSAYSADFDPVWRHAVPTCVVDRLQSARSGRVAGIGPSARLVVALADERALFDATQPIPAEPDVFPYSPELVLSYEKDSGRDYARDMMAVSVPFLGSLAARSLAVAELYETMFELEKGDAGTVRSFGSGSSGDVLVVTGLARIRCRLEKCFGDDGLSYGKRLAERGYRVDLVDSTVLSALSVDADGLVNRNGRRYRTMVLRHLSRRDADSFRRVLGTRPLGTRVYATDSPILFGAELSAFDPEIDPRQ